MCTKTGMNLNQELVAQLTKSPAIGQPALSDVINGVKSKAGSTAVRSARSCIEIRICAERQRRGAG